MKKVQNIYKNGAHAWDVDMLCPQHGAIYQGEDVNRFIDWFDRLEVGVI